MEISITTFAVLKEQLGGGLKASLPAGSLVSDLLAYLAKEYSLGLQLVASIRVVRDNQFLPVNEPLLVNDDLFLLPPSSGG